MSEKDQRVAIITGGSQGIGAGLVAAYRRRGWAVVATSRTIKPAGDPAVLTVHGDVSEPATTDRIISGALGRFGRIDTLINNAGVFISKPFTGYTADDYALVVGVNLTGFFRLTQRAITEMLKRGSASGVPGGWLDVVVDAGGGQQPVRAALVDAESGLGRQVVAAPADAVVFHRAARPVVGHGAVLQADAAARAEPAGEERAELGGAAVGGVRSDGLAEVPVRREGAHDRFGVTSGQRGLVAADHITRAGGPGPEDGRPQVPPPVHRPLAAVGAEHHRPIGGGLGHHRHRPRQLPPVAGQVRQQLHHRPPAGTRRGHRLDPGTAPGQPGLIGADEPPQLPVAADLARARIINRHLTRPHRLQVAAITVVQRGEVLPHRIRPARRPGLPARQLHRTDKIRKPRHRNHLLPWPDRPPADCRLWSPANILSPSATPMKAPHRQRS